MFIRLRLRNKEVSELSAPSCAGSVPLRRGKGGQRKEGENPTHAESTSRQARPDSCSRKYLKPLLKRLSRSISPAQVTSHQRRRTHPPPRLGRQGSSRPSPSTTSCRRWSRTAAQARCRQAYRVSLPDRRRLGHAERARWKALQDRLTATAFQAATHACSCTALGREEKGAAPPVRASSRQVCRGNSLHDPSSFLRELSPAKLNLPTAMRGVGGALSGKLGNRVDERHTAASHGFRHNRYRVTFERGPSLSELRLRGTRTGVLALSRPRPQCYS